MKPYYTGAGAEAAQSALCCANDFDQLGFNILRLCKTFSFNFQISGTTVIFVQQEPPWLESRILNAGIWAGPLAITKQ
jgi:hypothetical protein